MNSNRIIVAVGHKARHGKDTFATIISEALPGEVFITHWADPLKKEVTNAPRDLPLIFRKEVNNTMYYNLLNVEGHHYYYDVKCQTDLPGLHLLFEKRNIDEYWGMDEKDSEMLQIWGTDYRRSTSPNYWIDRTEELFWHRPEKFIVIPDTRFKNELARAKELGGIYIDVIRLNQDGTLYQDPSRDPLHLSETDLDGATADFEIIEFSGNMAGFKEKSFNIIEKIKGL